jgi:hypothetical protein
MESGAKLDASTVNSDDVIYYGWNAHVFNFNRKKHLMFVHNHSYYCVVIENVKKANILDMGNLFAHRLIEQWVADNVIEETEGLVYLQKVLPIILYKTNNDKRTIGAINALIDSYTAAHNEPYWLHKTLTQLNSALNEIPSGAGKPQGKYGNPVEDMRRVLDES